LRQLFDYDMLAVNPLDKLEAPKTKRVGAKLYTPEQFVAMLQWSLANSFHIMLQLIVLHRKRDVAEAPARLYQSASSGSFCCFIEPKHHSAGAFFLSSSKPAGSSSLL